MNGISLFAPKKDRDGLLILLMEIIELQKYKLCNSDHLVPRRISNMETGKGQLDLILNMCMKIPY